MLVSKRPYIPCANGIERRKEKSFGRIKKFIFVNRIVESHSRPIKAKRRKI